MTVVERLPAATERPVAVRRVAVGHLAAAAGLGLVAVLALALSVGGSAGSDAAPGLEPAGPLVDWGVPLSRLAGRLAALGTVGTLLFAAVLRPSAPHLPGAAVGALRAASVWATAWAAATAVHGLLTLASLVGTSLSLASVRIFLMDLPAGRAALAVLASSVLVAAAARRTATRRRAAALLAVAAVGLVVPVVLTGHSSAADDHVLAVTNLSLHVVAASVWVGGLLALLVHGRARDDLAPAAGRFSSVALACFLATGLSGVLAAWLVLAPGGVAAAMGTGYAWLLAGKTAALGVLGVLGHQHRRRTLPRLRAGEPGSFRRFAAVEAAVMLATVALAVGLSASPPPPAAPGGSPTAPAGATQAPAPAPEASASTAAEDMAGHDHGELSVTVLVDGSRFHVSAPVDAGSRVTVHNATATEVTITAVDGSFDVVVPGHALMTFAAPDEAGSYPFASRHSPSFADVLVVG